MKTSPVPMRKVLRNGLFLCSFIAMATFAISCKKKDKDPDPTPDPVVGTIYPEVNPLEGYLSATGFNQKITTQINVSDYEFGFSFIPTVKGKINAIVVKIPDIKTNLRVTIWDKMAGIIYRTELMDITAANVETTKVISALELVKDKEYYITFNSNDWYDHRKTDGSNTSYPVTVGDIKITGYGYNTGSTQELPNSPQLNYFAGDISFKFQRTE